MHLIGANIFLLFGLVLFLQGALSNFQRYHPCFFCYYHHFFNFRLQSSCSLADVPHPRLILVSLTTIKFSIVNSSLITEIKFSPFLLETVPVLTHFNLLSLRLIRNMHAIDFARYGYFQIWTFFQFFSSFNHWSSLLSQSIPLDYSPRPCSP